MRAIMVGIADCPKCRQAKAVLRERGLWPKLDYVESASAEGRRLAAEYGQDRLPFYVFGGRAYAYTGEFMRVIEEEREA